MQVNNAGIQEQQAKVACLESTSRLQPVRNLVLNSEDQEFHLHCRLSRPFA